MYLGYTFINANMPNNGLIYEIPPRPGTALIIPKGVRAIYFII